jgi:mono/diheme cytochrome c family protein
MASTARTSIMVGALLIAPLLAALTTMATSQVFTPRDESPRDYPEGPGRDQTFYTCTACHGFKLVAAQGQSRPQWEDTLDFMTQRHSMPKLEGADRKNVVDYLTASFPPRTAPRGPQNPFLKR